MKLSRVASAITWHLFRRHAIRIRIASERRRELYREFPIIRVEHTAPAIVRGRALLCFVAEPFQASYTAKFGRSHANYWQAQTIVAALASEGFDVDVTDWRNMHCPSGVGYNIVIGQGKAFGQACRSTPMSTPRVYLGWGMDPAATLTAVSHRCALVKRRRGFSIEQTHPVDDGPSCASDIIYLGNETTRQSLTRNALVPATAVPNPIVEGVISTLDGKDMATARTRFLWMAAYGTMRRGLDVLLEVFAMHPQYELWICGDISHEKSFFAAYNREIHSLPNIRYVGWVDTAGDEYRRITGSCGYILYPSVSDGMPGSVVNAMASGLVPIVTDAAGMECGGHGILLADMTHETILSVIKSAAAADPRMLRQEACDVAEFAKTFYSQNAFRSCFAEALAGILKRCGLGSIAGGALIGNEPGQ